MDDEVRGLGQGGAASILLSAPLRMRSQAMSRMASAIMKSSRLSGMPGAYTSPHTTCSSSSAFLIAIARTSAPALVHAWRDPCRKANRSSTSGAINCRVSVQDMARGNPMGPSG